MARLIGTIWTFTSTSGTASIVERFRTFVYSVSCSNLSFISLSMIYALMSPLCSFLMACILQVSGGPMAWSLCTRAQLFCFNVSSRSVASPIYIVISCTSVGLQVLCFIAWGIIGTVAVMCAYDSGPIGTSPFFVAIVAALWRALIFVQIAFMSQAYYFWVPQVQISSANVVKAAQRVVIAVVKKESIVERSLFASRDRFCSTCWVCSAAYIVYRTRS